MSNPTLLSNLLKNAQTVTSMESTDRLAVIDNAGNLKGINRTNATSDIVKFTLSSPQWVRIARFSSTAAVTLVITSTWQNAPGMRMIADLLLHINSVNYNHVNVFSRLSHQPTTPRVITKCRVVAKKGSDAFLDVYYSDTTTNPVTVMLTNRFNITPLPSMPTADVPEGYDVKELDLTVVGGG